jgi:hypothetical protein
VRNNLFRVFRYAALALLACSISRLAAAPLQRDLGGGLVYYRVQNFPADLPAAILPAPKHAEVLDLRYARAEPEAAGALATWLKSHATPRTPVLVLANAETSPSLLTQLATHDPKTGILSVGAPAPGFEPDIPVKVAPDADRRAFEAFATQPDAMALLKENAGKVRNDEARLSREHASPSQADAAEAEVESAAGDKSSAQPASPPVDYVLQRAFHLHRALLGLKKI